MGSPNYHRAYNLATDTEADLAMEQNSEAMAGNLARYHSWCLNQFPIPQEGRLLDIGCGRCLYFNEILKYQPKQYVAADYSQRNIDYLTGLFKGRDGFQTRHVDLTDAGSMGKLGDLDLDFILCFDVLEHIEDHLEALANLRSLLLSTGAKMLFLKVPALPSIYGSNDLAIGHYRRYSRRLLQEVLLKAGLKPLNLRYQNMPGIIPWFLLGRVLKRSKAVTTGESRLFDRVVPLVQGIEKIITPPFGLSLNAIVVPA